MAETAASQPYSRLLQAHDPRHLAAMLISMDATQAADQEAEKAWTTLGGNELFEEIGRGGMGVVYRARQRALDRTVAVKVLLRAQFASLEERARFHREAQATARLRHPGIVAIYEVGEDEGTPWFSMEYIPGRNLEMVVREYPMTAGAAADCVRKVAAAIQHAHEQGVLHRDLKPSNILLDAEGEPRVTDFGIARFIQNAATANLQVAITHTGQSLGSPAYAAPEQALDGTADARTDVFGLGALLYHLLTSRPPFQGPTVDAILVQLRRDDPLPPRRLNPTVPRDLDTICLKCLNKQPQNRYATAAALAEDLGRFLDGAGILARPPSSWGKAWRWSRRHPAMVALLGVIALLATGITGGSIGFARHQQRMEKRAGLMSEARALRQQRHAGARNDALNLLRAAWALAPSAEIRNEAAACLALPDIQPTDRAEKVTPPAAPDLPWPALPAGGLVAVDEERQLAAVVTARGKSLRLLSLADRREIAVCEHPLPITSVACSDNLIATGCRNRFIYIWTADGTLAHRLSGHDADDILVSFRPGTQELASTSSDVHIRLWHAARGEEIVSLSADHAPHTALWWSNDGNFLLGSHADGSTGVFEFQDAGCLKIIAPPQEEPHSENLGSAAFSPDGRLAAVMDEACCRVWDLNSARLLRTFPKAPGQWLSAQFAKDGAMLWLCGFDMELTAIPIRARPGGSIALGAGSPLLHGHGYLIRALSADGAHLLLSHNDRGEFAVFTPATKRLARVRHPSCLAAAIAPDGSWLATSSYKASGFKIWSLPEGKERHHLLRDEIVRQIEISPRGDTLLCNLGKGLRAFNTTTWSEIPLPPHTPLHAVAHSPAGGSIVTVGDDSLTILDSTTLAERLRLQLPGQAGWLGRAHAIFDGSGRYLMVHTALGTVARWDLRMVEEQLARLGISSWVE